MNITTPCIVCATQAQVKGSAFFATRGLDWPVTEVAGRTVHKACASDAEHIVQVIAAAELEVSATGIARWASNSRPLFADTVALIVALGFGEGIDPAATARAQEKDTAAFLAQYRATHPAEPDAEQLHEMRAAFGPGATVVDVISGRTTQL